MEFRLDRPRANQYQTKAISDELRRVVFVFENRRFRRHEFEAESKYCKVGSGEWGVGNNHCGGGLLYAIPWLGDEDSNLDRQSQSLQSYR